MVQKRSALDENSKTQILANELMRRLGNIDQREEDKVKGEVVDQFGVKIFTSGYSLSQTRRIALNEVRGWERKAERAKKDGRQLYRTAEDSLQGRIKKKTVGKTSWYKKRKNKDKDERQGAGAGTEKQDQNRRRGGKKRKQEESDNDLEVAAVLFVENTIGSGRIRLQLMG